MLKGILSKIMISGTLLVGLMSATAFASTWTISQENVSDSGRWSTLGSSNTKTTNDNDASFNGDALPNWKGYNVKLINSKLEARSSKTGLYLDKTSYAGNNSGLVGYGYYADVRSAPSEPNFSNVKLHFSADHK
ncbi:choline-binding protein [Periweissella fabalis]|uniref:Choline-binding protein n=1 Tax=Periweissella fabalis TaxID=1070421 RepID=A0A7X6N2S7_9LACO|nr:choline-binding protein [Periweissella fabalis]MCM0599885.1 choline-binding protein [Periweissella fabalis]NKZ24060.1 choline-binding protein [Periweissella fabalis]